MGFNLAEWGNALHSGEKSYGIVRHRRWWLLISTILVALSVSVLAGKGITFGMDFKGGTGFEVSDVADADPAIAEGVIADFDPTAVPKIQVKGRGDAKSISVEIPVVDSDTSDRIKEALAEAYGVDLEDNVSSDTVGASWGADVGKKAVKGLLIFLGLVALVMAVYFRAWRMAAAALIALAHDLVFTVGVYAAVGLEVSPASVIGFLTILGYSLYDTVVVFDKVRENTANLTTQSRYTYAELANLALNQTLVRSLNTSIVALLPVTSILFVGSILLGAGTLTDISLALFVGMAVGTYSSIFVATPLEVALRGREPRVREHTALVLRLREQGGAELDAQGRVRVGALVKGEHRGTAAQPKRKRRP